MMNLARKPRVGVDVDGVLADLLTPLFQHLNTLLGTTYAPDHMKDWDIAELVPPERRDEFWNTFGREVRVHDALQPLPGAVEGMKLLQEVADVYIVTAYLRSAPTWVHDRDRWLSEHFGVGDKKIVHTHAKYVFSGEMLIDDKPETVERWCREHPNGRGVLWDQPYNRAAATRQILWSSETFYHVTGGNSHAMIPFRTSDWSCVCAILHEWRP